MNESKFRYWLIGVTSIQTLVFSLIIFQLASPDTQPDDIAQHKKIAAVVLQELSKLDNQDTMVEASHRLADSAQLQAMIKDVLRSELRAALNQEAPEPQHQENLATTDVSYQQQEAVTYSSSIIMQAIANGVWTNDDTQALMPQLSQLTEQQRMTVLDEFHSAVNRQELEIEFFPPL